MRAEGRKDKGRDDGGDSKRNEINMEDKPLL